MKSNNVRLWLVGIAVAVLVVGGAYATGSFGARQMWAQPQATQTDPMARIAAALERIATAMEKPAGGPGMMGQMGPGMMGGMMGQGRSMMSPMGQMGDMSKMMAQMQERMQQCRTGQMQGMMGGPMAGRISTTQPVPSQPAPTQTPGLTETDLTRASEAASITVAVTFMNPLLKAEETAGKLVFKVALDTHTVDLSGFDMLKLAVLRTSEGVVVSQGFSWEPINESGHHRLGLLKLDGTVEGKPLITQETRYIELELKELGALPRFFRWEGEYLESKR